MKIWIVNHYADPPEGGKYLRHFHFAKELISRGYEVMIFTASTIHNTRMNLAREGKIVEKNYEGVPYVFVPVRNYSSLKSRAVNMLEYTFRLPKAVKAYYKPDVIYASSPHPFCLWIAGRLARRYHARFVAEVRDLWPETFVSMGKFGKKNPAVRALYALEKSMYKKADALIFTMPGGKDYLKKRKIYRDEVYYINNGVDLDEFEKQAKMPCDLREQSGFRVVYTGAMGRINDLHILLQSAKVLQDKGLPLNFYLYGGGTEEAALRQYKEEQALSRVHFMGRVEKALIPSILKCAHVNIITGKKIPLYDYGISFNKMFEYFASGVPVLSNLNCNYDIIEMYKAGKTVEGDDVDAMAEGLIYFYNLYEQNRKEYEAYGEQAVLAAEAFDFKKLTDTLENAFRRK